MYSAIKIRPVNSLLFLSDLKGGKDPTPVRGPMILSTPSCISFRCYPEQDGETEIVLGDGRELDPGRRADLKVTWTCRIECSPLQL